MTENSSELYCSKVEERHIDLFIAAWEDAFSRKLNEDIYFWLFKKPNKLYAVFDNEKIVAGYCLLEYQSVLDKQIVKAALCNNVFVSSSHQGKNLFVKLGRYALNQAQNDGIKIAIGIPNQNAIPGHKRVGWTFQDKVYFLEKPKIDSAHPIHKDIIWLKAGDCLKFVDSVENLSKIVSRNRSFSIIKTKDYFIWRYIARPNNQYRYAFYIQKGVLQGYMICKYYEPLNRIHIIDIEVTEESVCYELINAAESLQNDYKLINILESTAYKSCFLKSGYVVSSEYNEAILIKPYNKDSITFGSSYNLVLGDNDVF